MALARDTHLEIIPLLDEAPASFVMSHVIDRFDSGHVLGELSQPDDRQRRIFYFDGISAREEVTPLETETKLRRLLDYYFAGGQLRTYRLYPSVTTEWATNNLFGYSDMVEENISSADYAWFEPAMRVHSFTMKGLQVG